MASLDHSQLTRNWSWDHPVGIAGSSRERLAITMSVGAMGTLGFLVTTPLLPDLATAFGVSRGSIGWVQAAVSIAGVLLSALIGYLADRLGRRRVLLASLLLFTVFGCAGFLTRPTFGIAAAVMAVAAVTWRPARRRIRHLGSPAT